MARYCRKILHKHNHTHEQTMGASERTNTGTTEEKDEPLNKKC